MDYKNIVIENLTLQRGSKILFKDTKLTINNSNRYALIGPNGIGKTSIANLIYNKEDPAISEYLDILYIHQEAKASDNSVINEVLTCNSEREFLLKASTKLLERLSDESQDVDTSLIDEVQRNQEQLQSINYDKDESEVKKILSGLGFTGAEQKLPVKQFSGGWRMRISLAKALYLQPTLLILDEPTNHLDLEAVIWLTNYLSNWKKTLLVISHNIGFINEISTHVIHCDDLQLNYYRGNYYNFKKVFDQEYKKRLKDFSQYEIKLQAFKKNSKNTKKDVQSFIKKHGINRPTYTRNITMEFQEISNTKQTILELQNIDFSYTENKPIFNNLNLQIDKNDRIALVGRNGSGKSTLFKLLTGNLNPSKGSLLNSSNIRIGYFNQHFEEILPMGKNSIEYLQSVDNDLNHQEIRKYLGSFQIPGKSHEMSISNLSGGQKARLLFIGLLLKSPHLLLLDEPTNHLDIDTIQWLIRALNNYTGSVIVISHDEELITSINASIYVLKNNNIDKFYGEYSDYKDIVLSEY